jgi:hypothetical protein
VTSTTAPDPVLSETEQQALAIERLLALFAEAPSLGIAPEKMAIVALSAAINNLVAVYGEEKAAAILETVPEKVLAGSFTSHPGARMQ